MIKANEKELLKILNSKITKLAENGEKIAVKTDFSGKEGDKLALVSWDHYFSDLSKGIFRDRHSPRRSSVTWDFIAKNLSLVESIYNLPKKEIRVLDIGCSSGYLRKLLEENYTSVDKKSGKKIFYYGIDLRLNKLKSAILEKNNPESAANGDNIPSVYIHHNASQRLPFKDNSFDVVVSFEQIKYMNEKDARFLLSEIRRILKNDGWFHLSTATGNFIDLSLKHHWFEYSTEEIEEILKNAGFCIIGKYGTRGDLEAIKNNAKPHHRRVLQEMENYFPPEIIGAVMAPFYPGLTGSTYFRLIKKKN